MSAALTGIANSRAIAITTAKCINQNLSRTCSKIPSVVSCLRKRPRQPTSTRMRRFVFLVLASLTLFGCAQAQRAERCASYGHFRGSPDFEICMRQEQAIDLYKGEQLTRALLGAAAVYSATMPVQ